MRQHRILLGTLKRYLKHRGLTYKTLAKELGQSEANIKRIFSHEKISLERLDDLCEAAGTSIFQLAKMSTPTGEDESRRFTVEQEQRLAADRKLFAYFYLLLAGLPPPKILQHYHFTGAESTRYLVALDRMGLIELKPGDHVRVLASKNIHWITDGPLNALYREEIHREFAESNFRGPGERMRFLNAHLTTQSLERLSKRIDRLVAEFIEVAEIDQTAPSRDTQHIWFLVAYRPWSFSAVSKLRRKK